MWNWKKQCANHHNYVILIKDVKIYVLKVVQNVYVELRHQGGNGVKEIIFAQIMFVNQTILNN